MYRQQVRMSNSQSSGLENEFFRRVVNIPAFTVAYSITVEAYKHIKSSSRPINYALTTAEKAGCYLSDKIKPVTKKLEKPIKTVDQLACRGLESLEGFVPAVIKPPKLVVDYTRHIYAIVIKKGIDRYEDLKIYGISKANVVTDLGIQRSEEFFSSPYGIAFVNCLDSAFDFTELYLDYFLPPLGDEGPQKSFGDKEKLPTMDRADILSKRFKERFYKHSLLQIQKLQIRSRESLRKTNCLYLVQIMNHLVHVNFVATGKILCNMSNAARQLIQKQEMTPGDLRKKLC